MTIQLNLMMGADGRSHRWRAQGVQGDLGDDGFAN